MALLARPRFDNPEILGLDVAVRDRLAFEIADRREQVRPPAFEVAETQAALIVQPMSERPFGGVRKDQTRVARDIDRLAMYCDDRAVPQLAEDLALLADAVVASRVGCDFQDALLGVGVAHEQRDGGRAAAEAPDDLEPRDAVTRLSGERMDLLGFVVLLRFGELLLDEGDPVDEICDRGGPLGRVARRCVTDEGGEVLTGAVEDRRDLQGPVSLQAVGQRRERGRRWLAGEDVVGDRAEREDVQELRIGVGDRERLGAR